MTHRRLLPLAGLTALTLLVPAAPALAAPAATQPALVASQPALVATSAAGGASISVLGSVLAEIATSNARSAAAGATRTVRAQAVGVTGVQASDALAERGSDGRTRIPADGQLCGTPDLSAAGVPAALASALGLTAGCAEATAALDGAVSTAVAEASGLGVKVSAEALASVLTDLVIAPLTAALSSATGPVTMTTAQLTAAVGAVCAAVPAPATTVCASATAQLQAVSEPTAQELTAAVTAAITKALDGVDLLAISVGGTRSTTSTDADSVAATAEAAGLEVTSPSLNFLVAAIRAAVTAVLADYVDRVVTALTTSPAAALAATLGQQALVDQAAAAVRGSLAAPAQAAVTTIVDALVAALPFLADTEPLLTVSGADNTVAVVTPRGGGEVAVEASAGSVVVRLSKALAALLGVNATTTIAAGQDVPLFAGTPLASRVRVGSTSPLSATDGTVPVKGVRADGVTLDLLTGVMGGITVALAPVSAQVGAVPAEIAGSTPPLAVTGALPRTGGSAPWLAVLTLCAAGGLLVVRRRVRT